MTARRLKRLLAALICLLLLTALVLGALESPYPEAEGTEFDRPTRLQQPTGAGAGRPGVLRVSTYNVRRGKGNDGHRDLNRAAAVLRSSDVVGVQELSANLLYGLAPQAAQLADQLGMAYRFAPTIQKWFQPHFGNALLSRLAVRKWRSVPLPHGDGASGGFRNFVEAELVFRGVGVNVINTHLDRDALSARQLAFVISAFRKAEGPVILLGDLNVRPGNPQLKALTNEGAIDALEQILGRVDRVDWILVRGLEVVDGGMTPRGISDHPHFWVDLALTGAADL